MRLINADELPELETIETVKGKEVYTVSWIPKKAIEAAPTIEAIPVEWIKNWFNPKYASTVYYSLLRDMIKDWEKENAESN